MHTLRDVLRLTLLVILLLPLPAGAGQVSAAPNVAPPSPMRLINQLGGEASALTVSGGYAYLGIGPRLFILDISSQPGHVSAVLGTTLPLPGWIESIDVSGNYAYVALWEAGLAIIDVSQPSAPHLVGQLDTEGQSYSAILEGNYVYLSDGWWGIRKIDVSNKKMPVEVASLETNYARQLAIYGNYLYLADENSLMVIDKSTLAQVMTLPIQAYQVVVSGNYAYVTYPNNGDYSLDEFNLANPASPQKTFKSTLGGFSLSTINGIGYAIKSDWTSSTVREISGLGTGTGLSIAGSHPFNTNCTLAVGDANNYVYVACPDQGMSILQRNPLTGELSGPTGGYFTDFPGVQAMALSGSNLYLAAGNRGLVGLDMSDLEAPGYLGAYDTDGFSQDVALAGTFALVADGDKGLRSIDVSTSPFQFKDTFLPGTYVTSVAVYTPRLVGSDYRVYVGDYDGNFYSMDLSSTTGKFSNVSSLNVGGSISEIKLYVPFPFGTAYAYLAVGGKGLVILKTTGSMTVVKTVLGNANDVEIRVATSPLKIYAYVTDDPGLTILDVTDPASIIQKSFYALTEARAVDVLNDQVFLTAGYDVWMLDGADLSQPKPAGFYKRANYSYDVIGIQRDGDPTVTLLTADSAYGLYVLGPAAHIFLPLCIR